MPRKSIFPRARAPRSFRFVCRKGDGRRVVYAWRWYQNIPLVVVVLVSVPAILAGPKAVGLLLCYHEPTAVVALVLSYAGFAVLLAGARERIVFDPQEGLVTWITWRRPVRRAQRFSYEQVEVRLCKTVLLAPDDDLRRAVLGPFEDWHGYTLVVHLAGSPVILARNKKHERVVKMAEELQESTGIPWSWADDVMYERRHL